MSWLSDTATQYKDVAIVGSWALTAIGWFLNARTSNQRELRKEVRKEIDDCIKAAYDLLQLTKDYYYDPERTHDAGRTSQIRFDLQRLLTRIERLSGRCKKITGTYQLGELMDRLTGDDFDTVTRRVLVPRDERVRAMEQSVHALIDKLEDGFLQQFPD